MGYYNLPPTQYAAELTEIEKLLRALLLEGAIPALDLLETLLRNVLQNPNEEKFRKVRCTNEKLAALFGMTGAKEIMVAMGWQEQDEFMVLPTGVNVDFQQHMVKVLEAKSYYGKQRESEKRSAKLAADPNKADMLRQLELDRRERAAAAGTAAPAAPAQALPIGVARPAAAPTVPGYPAAAAAAAPTGTLQVPAAAAAQAPAPKTPSPSSEGSSKHQKSAFDFERRSAVEGRKKESEMSLAELRAAQKAKYQDFQADPDAKNSEAYKRPPSSANGSAKEAGWFDWLWGDSSSSSSGGGGGYGGGGGRPGGGQQGPRMKTLKDLPAPVRRGG